MNITQDEVEAIIFKCIPGGDTCDPQKVADTIREYCASGKQSPAKQNITLRDQFAVAALPYMMEHHYTDNEQIAWQTYCVADAMIAERNKNQ